VVLGSLDDYPELTRILGFADDLGLSMNVVLELLMMRFGELALREKTGVASSTLNKVSVLARLRDNLPLDYCFVPYKGGPHSDEMFNELHKVVPEYLVVSTEPFGEEISHRWTLTNLARSRMTDVVKEIRGTELFDDLVTAAARFRWHRRRLVREATDEYRRHILSDRDIVYVSQELEDELGSCEGTTVEMRLPLTPFSISHTSSTTYHIPEEVLRGALARRRRETPRCRDPLCTWDLFVSENGLTLKQLIWTALGFSDYYNTMPDLHRIWYARQNRERKRESLKRCTIKCIGVLMNRTKGPKYDEYEFYTGRYERGGVFGGTMLVDPNRVLVSEELLERSVLEVAANPCELVLPGRLELLPQIMTRVWGRLWS